MRKRVAHGAALALLAGIVVAAIVALPIPRPAAAALPQYGPVRASEDTVPRTPTDADTTLRRFLRSLSDSTDYYFGIASAPPETTGYDSALAYALAHPQRPRRRLILSASPDFRFNRVDGPLWGAATSIGEPRGIGRLGGKLAYAAGPNVWQGGGEYRNSLERPEGSWSLRVFGGRYTATMDPDYWEPHLSSMRALVTGTDYEHHYRRDGVEAWLGFQNATLGLALGYRDMLESPLATTTTWNFAGRRPVVTENLAAALGRARELELGASWRLPWLPVTVEAIHRNSGDAFHSDFDYRRTRLALGGNFGLGQIAALVPQLAYGRLSGTPVPQEAFYLGGAHSLRSLRGSSLGGTGLALARLDLIGTTDVLEWAHIPHPAALPIQAGVFGGIGAVWGSDPYGGPSAPGVDWPHREAWRSEAGVSLVYQPGVPDPTGLFRFDLAWPVGGHRGGPRWTITFTQAMDLVRPLGR